MKDKRSDEELNLIITKWRGWIFADDPHFLDLECACKPPDKNGWREPLRYCSDLNAMHEAEKELTTNQVTDYVTHLRGIQVPIEWSGCWGVHATARKRAEALVAMIELK